MLGKTNAISPSGWGGGSSSGFGKWNEAYAYPAIATKAPSVGKDFTLSLQFSTLPDCIVITGPDYDMCAVYGVVYEWSGDWYIVQSGVGALKSVSIQGNEITITLMHGFFERVPMQYCAIYN